MTCAQRAVLQLPGLPRELAGGRRKTNRYGTEELSRPETNTEEPNHGQTAATLLPSRQNNSTWLLASSHVTGTPQAVLCSGSDN